MHTHAASRPHPSTGLSALAVAAVLLSACPGLAWPQADVQDSPPGPNGAPAQADAQDTSQATDRADAQGGSGLLAGPSIEHVPAPPTLVQRDFAGRIVRLPGHPAQAAAELLLERNDQVSAPARQAIDAILAERRRALDELVIDRLDLLLALRDSPSQQARGQAIADLRRALAPLASQGDLGQRIRACLPEPLAAEHLRLEQEYRNALVEERLETLRRERPDSPAGLLRLRARAIENLLMLGEELRAAYDRTIVQQGEDFEALLARLALTPEQEGKVRAIVGRYAQRALLDAQVREDRSARVRVFLEVAAELTPDQRRVLLDHVRGR